MDDGGYKFIYDDKKYQILDEIDYFAVDEDYKHIASFKERDEAFKYVMWKRGYL